MDAENLQRSKISPIDCYLTITIRRQDLVRDFETQSYNLSARRIAYIFDRIAKMLNPAGDKVHFIFRNNIYNLPRYFAQRESSVIDDLGRTPWDYPFRGFVSQYLVRDLDLDEQVSGGNRQEDFLYLPGDEVSDPTNASEFITYVIPAILLIEKESVETLLQEEFMDRFKTAVYKFLSSVNPVEHFWNSCVADDGLGIIGFTLFKSNLATSEKGRRKLLKSKYGK